MFFFSLDCYGLLTESWACCFISTKFSNIRIQHFTIIYSCSLITHKFERSRLPWTAFLFHFSIHYQMLSEMRTIPWTVSNLWLIRLSCCSALPLFSSDFDRFGPVRIHPIVVSFESISPTVFWAECIRARSASYGLNFGYPENDLWPFSTLSWATRPYPGLPYPALGYPSLPWATLH